MGSIQHVSNTKPAILCWSDKQKTIQHSNETKDIKDTNHSFKGSHKFSKLGLRGVEAIDLDARNLNLNEKTENPEKKPAKNPKKETTVHA